MLLENSLFLPFPAAPETAMSSCIMVHLRDSLSRETCHVVTSANDNVDLDFIAKKFCLEPHSLRLNNHLIAQEGDGKSSLTWIDVVSFFEKRGFSTGRNNDEAIRVDGKRSLTRGASLERMQKRQGKDLREPFSQHSKRFRQSDHSGTSSEVNRSSSPEKRTRVEDPSPSFPMQKRARQDDLEGGLYGEILQERKESRNLGKHPREDHTIYRSLWKRLKEIKV